MKIGFIGLGKMGGAIAANLVRAQHDVVVWNRSPEKARDLVAAGAVLAASPKAAASDREIVITMLADDAALEAVLSGAEGILAGLRADPPPTSMSKSFVAPPPPLPSDNTPRGQGLFC